LIAEVVDRRAARRVGRKARLEVVFGVRRQRTVVTHAYAEPPFRIARPFTEGAGLRMIMAWSAPGIFGGDDLEQHVCVERGAQVQLFSQSALQAHPSPDGAMATLRSTFQVEEGASLVCEWDPLIPFAASRLTQRIDLGLAAGAWLWWSDALMSGRQARGERWRFETLDHELRLTIAGRLQYLERYQLCPHRHGPPMAPWLAASADYFGTIVSNSRGGGECLASLADELGQLSAVRAGVDALEDGLTLVRLMSGEGGAFHQARARTRAFLCADSAPRAPQSFGANE
jgi:urease accessory protein